MIRVLGVLALCWGLAACGHMGKKHGCCKQEGQCKMEKSNCKCEQKAPESK